VPDLPNLPIEPVQSGIVFGVKNLPMTWNA
jgi:hypothetical protein